MPIVLPLEQRNLLKKTASILEDRSLATSEDSNALVAENVFLTPRELLNTGKKKDESIGKSEISTAWVILSGEWRNI